VIPETFAVGPLEQDLEAGGAQAFSSLGALWHEEHMRRLCLLPQGARAKEDGGTRRPLAGCIDEALRQSIAIVDVIMKPGAPVKREFECMHWRQEPCFGVKWRVHRMLLEPVEHVVVCGCECIPGRGGRRGKPTR
jgi:hypothetical protein